MTNLRRRLPATMAMAAFVLAPGCLYAQDEPVAQDEPFKLTDPGNWVLGSSLGAGTGTGGYGEFLEEPVNVDLNIQYQPGDSWRFGVGIQFGSMDMKPPHHEEKEWARFDTYLFATKVFNPSGKVRPYLQARLGIARIHPRSELFWFDDPENLEPGASPTDWANGLSWTLQPGVEIALNDSLALDLSGWYTGYRTSDYSLRPELNGPPDPPLSENEFVSDGQEYGFRVGLQWRPVANGVRVEPEPRTDPTTGTLFALPPADSQRDEWGVPRSWGWAIGETMGINWVASMINEYVRQANFNQISPRSFYDNFKTGWTFDDNEFATNQLIHPFNGATYFNAARKRPGVLAFVGGGECRRLHVGVLRRNAPDVVERHDQHRHRRHGPRGVVVPDLLADPGQHEDRLATLHARVCGPAHQSDPHGEPLRVLSGHDTAGQPGRPLRLAASLPWLAAARRSPGHRRG